MHDITDLLRSDDRLRQVLPLGWMAEKNPDGSVTISGFSPDADRHHITGYVTVSEALRNFAIGLSPPHSKRDDIYHGRAWRRYLYKHAVQALQSALEPVSVHCK